METDYIWQKLIRKNLLLVYRKTTKLPRQEDFILAAVLTVSPNTQNLGSFTPIIPAAHGPNEKKKFSFFVDRGIRLQFSIK